MKESKGNLFENYKKFGSENTIHFIIHGCNSHGVMGSGIAVEVKKLFPEAFKLYRKQYESTGLPLGTSVYYQDGNTIVVNAVTQKDFGKDAKRYSSYDAICSCFEELKSVIDNLSTTGVECIVHTPLIGCGLANGNWNIVKTIIEETLTGIEVVLHKL